jgi:hypothetical protein
VSPPHNAISDAGGKQRNTVAANQAAAVPLLRVPRMMTFLQSIAVSRKTEVTGGVGLFDALRTSSNTRTRVEQSQQINDGVWSELLFGLLRSESKFTRPQRSHAAVQQSR